MTPGQRHAVLASAALVPFAVYEAVEVAQGADGWPYSRFIRLLPAWLFLTLLGVFNVWFGPHILRKTASAVAAVVEAFDDSRPEIEETP